MKKISFVICCAVIFGVSALADNNWIDVTQEVAGNPLEQAGWTIDDNGKVFRSEDGNKVKIEHSEYGVFIIDLPGEKVEKMQDEKAVSQKNAELLQRDGGMMLVVRVDEYKFRVRFSERVSGMHSISGIRGM